MENNSANQATNATRKAKKAHLIIHGSVLLIILALEALQPVSGQWLSLNQAKLFSDHQWWRLLTGHLVHLSWEHTALNCVGLTLISAIFAPQSHTTPKNLATPGLILIFYLVTALTTSTLLLRFDPQIKNYFGLSGVLYGLIIFYLICDIRNTPKLSAGVLLAIFLKIAWDLTHSGEDHLTAELIGGPVASTAHLYGSFGGALVGLMALTTFYSRKNGGQPPTPIQ